MIRHKKISMKDVLYYKRLHYSIYSFSKEEVSSNKRVLLNSQIISKLDLRDRVFIIPDHARFILCKDKGIYDDYKKSRR